MIYSLIILLPLLSFISGSCFGLYLGYGVCIITVMSSFFTCLLSLLLFLNLFKTNIVYKLVLGTWVRGEEIFYDLGGQISQQVKNGGHKICPNCPNNNLFFV